MSKLTVDYKGLVVSTCAIEPSNPEHGDEVTFKESSTGGKAVFLMKVKEYDNSGDFKAKYVSPERAARHVELFPKLNRTNKDTSPLFVVHGFNTQPAEHMTGVATKWPRFTDAGLNYYPIPVIWPCNDSNFIVRYSRDQEDPSQRAGKELTALVDAIPNDLFPRKSLLMHSMGNHVVFNGACGMKDQTGKVVDKAPDVEFDNIFLAAAVSFVIHYQVIFIMHTSCS
jgi:esterase/lipase superfamily enzyme